MSKLTLPVRYRTGAGRPLISVTQILTVTNQIDAAWFTPESALRGQKVHDLTEVYDKGELYNFPEDVEGYLDAYALFVRDVRPAYRESEVELIHPTLGFAGRIDRICDDIYGHPGHLDFKTGVKLPWHGQQLSGYNLLRPTGVRWACYLGKNGKYKLKRYDDPTDHIKFMHNLIETRKRVCNHGDDWISEN